MKVMYSHAITRSNAIRSGAPQLSWLTCALPRSAASTALSQRCPVASGRRLQIQWLTRSPRRATTCSTYSVNAWTISRSGHPPRSSSACGLPPLTTGHVRAGRRHSERRIPLRGARRPRRRPPDHPLRRRRHGRVRCARTPFRDDRVRQVLSLQIAGRWAASVLFSPRQRPSSRAARCST